MYTWLTAVKIAKHWRLLSANICISCQVDTSVYSGASVSANVLLSFGGYARVSHISSSVYTQTNMNTKNIKTLFSSDDSTLYLIQLTEVGFICHRFFLCSNASKLSVHSLAFWDVTVISFMQTDTLYNNKAWKTIVNIHFLVESLLYTCGAGINLW